MDLIKAFFPQLQQLPHKGKDGFQMEFFIFFQRISRLAYEFLAPKGPGPSVKLAPSLGASRPISGSRELWTWPEDHLTPPWAAQKCWECKWESDLDRCLPLGALCLLTCLQNRLRKVPLPSAPAWVCHLPSAQTWWPQLNLDTFTSRAVRGYGVKGHRPVTPTPALDCYLWQPLQARKRPATLPLSSDPATKYILTQDINLGCQSMVICIANSQPWWHFTTGSRTCDTLLGESHAGEIHFVVTWSAEKRQGVGAGRVPPAFLNDTKNADF